MARRLGILFLACCWHTLAGAAEVTREQQPYTVLGTTAEALRSSMDRLGPLDPRTQQHRDSLTRWTLAWRYDTQDQFGRCDLTRVWTQVQITQIQPRLGQPETLAPALRRDWERFAAALSRHDEAMAAIALQAAAEIDQALPRLNRKECKDLRLEAEATARNIVATARQREAALDLQTDRGRSAGARFPWQEGDPDNLTDRERAKLKDRLPVTP
ncbi:MAG: DUF922 domain-containing protein [Rhodocyclaceae bacterium]|jgi:predicted secreted Zn-dependent protease|nr:DUF922 domain-containing protein [Rhodocyclaceae bacterium]